MKDIQAGRDSHRPPWAVSRRDSPALLIPDNLVALAEPDIHRPSAASHKCFPACPSPDSRIGRETLRFVTGRTDYWDHMAHPCPAVRDSQVGTDSHWPWAVNRRDSPALLIPDNLVAPAEPDIHRPWAASRRDSPASLSPDSRVGRETLHLVTGRTDYWDHKAHPYPAVRDSQVGTDSHRPWAACRRDSPAS